jgi:intraflagellar transport protein 122
VTNTSEEIIKMDQSDLNGDDFAQLLLDDNKQSKVVINREILKSMHWKSVIIKKWPPPLRYQYFCSVLPNVHISLCPSCQHVR